MVGVEEEADLAVAGDQVSFHGVRDEDVVVRSVGSDLHEVMGLRIEVGDEDCRLLGPGGVWGKGLDVGRRGCVFVVEGGDHGIGHHIGHEDTAEESSEGDLLGSEPSSEVKALYQYRSEEIDGGPEEKGPKGNLEKLDQVLCRKE